MCVFFLGTLGECSGYVCSVAWGKGCAGGVGMVWVACGVVRVPSRGRVLCVCVCVVIVVVIVAVEMVWVAYEVVRVLPRGRVLCVCVLWL